MRKRISLFLLIIALPLTINGCRPGQSLTETPQLPTPTSSPTITLEFPTATPIVQEEPIPVTGLNVVKFDPSIFPTDAEEGIQDLLLQRGNYSPITVLETKPSSELQDNRIGDVATITPNGIEPRIWEGGTKWMRVVADSYGEWQHADWETGDYEIDPEEEQGIDELVSNGVRVMLVLDIWYGDHRTVYHKTEEDIAIYLNWVRYMVRHFNGRIDYYEILNEPDMNFAAPSGMPMDAYVNLVERTAPVIREEDPNAKIVVGAVPDTRFNHTREWLWELLNSEIMPLVDGISWHGMYGAAPSDDPRGVRDPSNPQMENYWENYPAFVEEIKSTAAANGFEGEFMTEEMLWRTPSHPHESEPYGFTDVSGAKYAARSIIIHLGLDVSPGLAIIHWDSRPITYAVIRNLANVMAGTDSTELPVVIESEANNIRHYTFTCSNGDKLLAVWTDGVASEDDSYEDATVRLPDFSAGEVIAIDVFYGFEQQIIASNEDGNLVVQDLQVKDYPVILRFKSVKDSQ